MHRPIKIERERKSMLRNTGRCVDRLLLVRRRATMSETANETINTALAIDAAQCEVCVSTMGALIIII